jgi:2'-hydroxyisoflavone reductase
VVEGATVLTDDSYGGRKAACEQVVLSVFGPRAVIARPGLIVGPHDPTERFPYWPRRLARGGRVLAPGAPDDPMQFIDVRDLARFLVSHSPSGVFNIVTTPMPFGDLLSAMDASADLAWISTPDLLAAKVDPWMGVPLWIGDPEWAAANHAPRP